MGTTAFHRSGHFLLHHTSFPVLDRMPATRREETFRTYYDTTNYISLDLSGFFSTTGRSIESVFLHPHTRKYIHPRFILTCSYLLFENIYIYETVHLVLGLLSNHKFNSHHHPFTHCITSHPTSRFQVHSIFLFMDTFGFHYCLVHNKHRHPS